MEMVAKRSSLVLPNNFVKLDREEMTYIEGGAEIYFSYANITSVIKAFSMATFSLGGAMAALKIGWSAILLAYNALPIAGQAICLLAASWSIAIISLMACAWTVGQGFYIGIDVKWNWFVPIFSNFRFGVK